MKDTTPCVRSVCRMCTLLLMVFACAQPMFFALHFPQFICCPGRRMGRLWSQKLRCNPCLKPLLWTNPFASAAKWLPKMALHGAGPSPTTHHHTSREGQVAPMGARQAGSQPARQIDTDRQTDRQAGRRTDGQADSDSCRCVASYARHAS